MFDDTKNFQCIFFVCHCCHENTCFKDLSFNFFHMGFSCIITEVTLFVRSCAFLVTNDIILHHLILCRLCTFWALELPAVVLFAWVLSMTECLCNQCSNVKKKTNVTASNQVIEQREYICIRGQGTVFSGQDGKESGAELCLYFPNQKRGICFVHFLLTAL